MLKYIKSKIIQIEKAYIDGQTIRLEKELNMLNKRAVIIKSALERIKIIKRNYA